MTQYTPKRSPIQHNGTTYSPGEPLPEMSPNQLKALQSVGAVEPMNSSDPEVEVNLEGGSTSEDLRKVRQDELEAKSTDEVKAIAKDHGITYQSKRQAIADILEKEGLTANP